MTVAPIRREVLVGAPIERTFELFTGHIGAWWPLAAYSVFGDGTVGFEDREVVERSGEKSSVWAEVLEWDPPAGLRLAWHPGSDRTKATDLRVTFTPDGDQTLVRVEHAGWEIMSDPAAAANEYGQGWPGVLGGFASFVGSWSAVDR